MPWRQAARRSGNKYFRSLPPCSSAPIPTTRRPLRSRLAAVEHQSLRVWLVGGPPRLTHLGRDLPAPASVSFRLHPAFPNVLLAAMLCDAAHSELRARPTQLTSTIKRPVLGRQGPPLANPPWCRMIQRRPSRHWPASAWNLTQCSVSCTLVPLLALSVPRRRSVLRHSSQFPVAHRPSVAC